MTDEMKRSAYLPTPEEIERKCREIRSHWTEKEQERRARFIVEDSKFALQPDGEM